MKFFKYHALGNDYIVLPPQDDQLEPDSAAIKRICHRNFGIGSDGILFGPLPSKNAPFGLKIFNPDGSEAEKSGNGLRIFSRYLWDQRQVSDVPFQVETPGGIVRACVQDMGRTVSVEMGKLSFWSHAIPVSGTDREVLNEVLALKDQELTYSAATIGNPHCVILRENLNAQDICNLGPSIENHALFPNRINVQFLKVIDRSNIQIEIWERGAGYTLASGSSSCAAAGVAYKLGLVDGEVTVNMPGGKLTIQIDKEFNMGMRGPVTRVFEGELDNEIFR